MGFEKKEWKYKDTITAEELNRLEDGIAESGSTSEVAVYHFKEDEDNSTAEFQSFVQANANKSIVVLDDEYGYMQTVVQCEMYGICTLLFDGELLWMHIYRPDAEFPNIVNRGIVAIYDTQIL